MMQEEVGDSKIIEYNKAYLELSFDDSVSQARFARHHRGSTSMVKSRR